ncbi:MAG: serine/threonine protein kinase [Deltaproteobacteria bacterium]|nr:serine/threonine protein kinase [Deltaproteobacteria bacterium]
MSEDKRTKIGPTGPQRTQPGSATPAPVTPAPMTPAPGTDPSKHATSYLPAAPPQVDPLLGQVLAGRYLISRKLGEGGMGAVYLATHNLLEKQVALKVLHNEFARKPDLVERFIQEAKAASRIRHENVIDISDFGATPEGLVFFAMELLQGHDLHEEVARARLAGQLLPFERSKKIFLQICAALSAAHAKGIVHRDLKPENVYLVDFLGDPDFVKLLDFGIAKLTEVNDSERKLTKTGMLFGTPEYMSPEQARGENVDLRVDVYAMGCILFQLVTGRVPFEADNFMGVLSLHLTEPPPSIPQAVFDRIGAPRELADVIEKALAKDRGQRWQTIDDLANAVRAVCGDAAVNRGATGMVPTQQRAPSVQAPEITKEARTTPAPMAPTTQQTQAQARQKTQWTGNLQVPQVADEAPARTKSKVPLIIGGLAIAVAASAGVYLGTRGGKIAEPATVPSDSAVGGESGAQVPPDAPPAPVPAPVPDYAEIKLDSKPGGAEIKDLLTGRTLGKTPKGFKLKGSHTPRQFQLALRGYSDAIIELVPSTGKIEYTETLQRGSSGMTPVVRIVPNTGSGAAVRPEAGSGSAVTPVTPVKPEVGSGSAKPPEPGKPDGGGPAVVPPVDDCDDPPCIKTNIPGLRDGGVAP